MDKFILVLHQQVKIWFQNHRYKQKKGFQDSITSSTPRGSSRKFDRKTRRTKHHKNKSYNDCEDDDDDDDCEDEDDGEDVYSDAKSELMSGGESAMTFPGVFPTSSREVSMETFDYFNPSGASSSSSLPARFSLPIEEAALCYQHCQYYSPSPAHKCP